MKNQDETKIQYKKVLDTDNYQHFYDEEKNLLGEGGQGAVYRTKDGDTALKIDNGEEPLESFQAKIERLIYKPLLDLDIITPLVLLKEQKGYVMKLLDNFKPLMTFTPNGVNPDDFTSEDIPSFLQDMFKSNPLWACKITHYKNTGGLRMRLFLLKRIACILSALHLRGMVYCDLSPNNVFVSDSKTPLVKFIDADNIEYQSKIQSGIYTPNYEIPEIDMGSNNSMYSDIYAFGILAFYLLTMVYPFVEIEADWDSDSTQSKKIWDGEWIDSEHFSGEYNDGLRGVLSTEPLRELFSATFEDGKLTPHKRAIMPLWINAIEKALNDTLKCPKCEMNYYDRFFESCPYCDEAKPLRVVIESSRARFVRELDSTIDVPVSLIEPINLNKNAQDILFSIKKDKNNVILEKQCDKKIKINNKEIFSRYKRSINEFNNIAIMIDTHSLTLRIER